MQSGGRGERRAEASGTHAPLTAPLPRRSAGNLRNEVGASPARSLAGCFERIFFFLAKGAGGGCQSLANEEGGGGGPCGRYGCRQSPPAASQRLLGFASDAEDSRTGSGFRSEFRFPSVLKRHQVDEKSTTMEKRAKQKTKRNCQRTANY